MGIIAQGILGAISGRVGPVVGGSWKGIAYLRGYQPQVAQPNTAAQVAQKSKMRGAVDLAKSLLTQIIKPLNDRWAVRMSGYNLWVSRNIEAFSSLGVPDPLELIMSEGSLTPTLIDFVTVTDGSTTIKVDWTDNTGTGTALATDEAYIVAFNQTANDFAFSSGLVARSESNAIFDFTERVTAGDSIYTYLSMRSANGFNVSNQSLDSTIVP
jgi:hypothetical protein